MADIQIPESVPCKFNQKGWAPCKKPSTNGWCSKHEETKCISCGKHAIQSCDQGMGGLTCGVALCATCKHSLEDSSHVIESVYQVQLSEEITLQTTGRESIRMLAKRGVPTDFPLPANLQELLGPTWEGRFNLKLCHFLQLKHNCMGDFPAILKGTKIPLITPDKEAVIQVWKSLPPRDSQIISEAWMVNEDVEVAYEFSSVKLEQKRILPHKLFTRKAIEALFENDPQPFKWAPGLLGADISQERFKALILAVA
jgi:hypothetical protein